MTTPSPATPREILIAARKLRRSRPKEYCVTTAIWAQPDESTGAKDAAIRFFAAAVGVECESMHAPRAIWDWWDGATSRQRYAAIDRAIAATLREAADNC